MTSLPTVKGKVLAMRDGVTYTERAMGRKKLPPEVQAYFARMGRIGGKLGGPARAAAMTADERKESARRAVQARWEKRKDRAPIEGRDNNLD